MRQRRWTLAAALTAVLVAGGAALALTSGGDRSAAAPRPAAGATSPGRVIVPGRPGEPVTVTDSDRVGPPDGSTYNAVDTTFVQMMIVHHTQAVRMAELAPSRASNAGVRGLAGRIGAAQGPEIEVLRGWLRARRLPGTDPAHDHATMPGMQSPADLAVLAAATGPDFDRRFVAMMTAHHRGAVRMARDVLAGGTDQTVREMAGEMAVEQSSEIRRMAELNAGRS